MASALEASFNEGMSVKTQKMWFHVQHLHLTQSCLYISCAAIGSWNFLFHFYCNLLDILTQAATASALNEGNTGWGQSQFLAITSMAFWLPFKFGTL
ncbi:hypothetical protein GOBAR_DD24525 [Gossypium barbadense]|nr:hypothetical protein GOBAR_DD24525 [Gossypium barbadense]